MVFRRDSFKKHRRRIRWLQEPFKLPLRGYSFQPGKRPSCCNPSAVSHSSGVAVLVQSP